MKVIGNDPLWFIHICTSRTDLPHHQVQGRFFSWLIMKQLHVIKTVHSYDDIESPSAPLTPHPPNTYYQDYIQLFIKYQCFTKLSIQHTGIFNFIFLSVLCKFTITKRMLNCKHQDCRLTAHYQIRGVGSCRLRDEESHSGESTITRHLSWDGPFCPPEIWLYTTLTVILSLLLPRPPSLFRADEDPIIFCGISYKLL